MKLILYVASLLLLSSPLCAQYNWDAGLKLGGTSYLGEMGGNEDTRRDFVYDMKLKQTRRAIGAFARYRFSPIISGAITVNYLRIQGGDNLSTNPARVARNLSFRNDMFEFNGRGEIVFYHENDVGHKGRRGLDFKAFFFAGVGGLVHSPKANYDGNWVKLRPLQTEGPANTYKALTFTLPTGIGLYFTYKKKHRFGWDIGWRTTFTDYLDDVSTTYVDPSTLSSETALAMYNRNPELGDYGDALPSPDNYGWFPFSDGSARPANKRGDPTHNDSYLVTQFTYSYVMRGKSSFYKQKYGWLQSKKKRGRKSRAKF
jgi:hypothetical protein